MEYRKLGKAGLEVSVLTLGAAQFGAQSAYTKMLSEQDAVDALVGAAVDAGINSFDTAQLYGEGRSEEMLGHALKPYRDRAIIITKFREFGTWTKDDMLGRLKSSLQRLGTDHVDVYMIHWPCKEFTRAAVNTMTAAFTEAKRAGLIRWGAVSNFTTEHFKFFTPEAVGIICANEVSYSLLARDHDFDAPSVGRASCPSTEPVGRASCPPAEGRAPARPGSAQMTGTTAAYCRDHGIALLAYSPNNFGLLTGQYTRANRPTQGWLGGMPGAQEKNYPETMKLLDELRAVADQAKRTLTQTSLNWLLAQPNLASAIIGTRLKAHLDENLGAVGWQLPPESLARLDRASDAFHRFLTSKQ